MCVTNVMSTATRRREREKVAIRAKIMDAARQLFAERGYEAVTMRTIAERIEYTPTAIYYHFRDKDALIREICNEDFAALAAQFQRIAGIKDPMERLHAAGVAYADFAFAHPNQYRLMFMTPSRPVDECEDVVKGNPESDAYAFLKWTVGEAIAAGQLRPEYADVDMTAQLCWAAVHGVVALHIDNDDDTWVDWKPVEATVKAMLDLLLRGLTAKGR